MADVSRNILDLTRDIAAASQMGATAEQVNELLGESLETLGKLIPFDLATIMELAEEELTVRVSRGALSGPKVDKHKLRLADFPAIRELLKNEQARAFTDDDHRDGDGDAFDGVLDLPHGHSCMVVPLKTRSGALGIMTFDRESCGRYEDSVVELAGVIGKLLAMSIGYGGQSAMLTRLRDQLQEQNRLLGEDVDGRANAGDLIEASRSPAMMQVAGQARQVAITDAPVLITGETGTGKEVLANAIHEWSPRAGRPMISINCAALPENLIESELFGHVKGAFSGATKSRMGRFQAANGGTLLLDEIGEMPLDLQAKLLRALQDGCFEPVGSDRTIRVDVRVIAATNADLLLAVAERRFREDLYYRLAVFPLHLPPLRARQEDIIPIAENFLALLSGRTGRGPWVLNDGAKSWLLEQEWRGNVRELINHLERATILSRGQELVLDSDAPVMPTVAEVTKQEQEDDSSILTLEEMERRHIEKALSLTGGKLYGEGGSADLLGINPNTLRSRMKKLGLGGARDYRSRKIN
jgi:transcriptional regulator with GAF, ATPase, and Fis domain